MHNEFELNWKKIPFYGIYTTNSTFTLILKADKFCTKIILFYPNFHILSGLNIKNERQAGHKKQQKYKFFGRISNDGLY
jgi:hypothetical protein